MIERVRERMKEKDIEVLVVSESENIKWLLDRDLKGYVFLTEDELRLIAPVFYRFEELDEFDSVELCFSRSEYEEAIEEKAELFDMISVDSLGGRLKDHFECEESDIISELRRIKTEEEVEKMRKACQITDDAFEMMEKKLFSGMTERELQLELKKFYSREGVTESFIGHGEESLVQRNCLRPHREPEDVEIEEEDLVIVDTGARYQDYAADMTRTYCKDPSEEQRNLYEAVKSIQEELIDMIEPGRDIAEVKKRELELVEEKGYSLENVLYYSHAIGREVHEKPSISHESEEEFEEGMVLTLEPGLHIEGLGGVRIEDMVHVTENGVERLSEAPKNLEPRE